MSEETPAAPAPQAAPAETSTPTTPAPETSAAPASEPTAQTPATAPAESASYFTKEQLAEMETMFANNGGFDKAWARMKDAISRPQQPAQPATQPEAPQDPSQPQTVQEPVQAPEAPQNASQSIRAGSISMEEMAAQQYFNALANDPKYENIADEIKSGAVLKGLKDFNISPLENGRINDADVRKYLDLYAASKPAKPTSVVPSETPAEYVQTATEGKVTSMDEANKIQLQSIQLRNAGQPPHPLEEAAKAFVKDFYSKGMDKKR